MSDLLETRHISTSISRSPVEVYAFASRPENLPLWAAGLGGAVEEHDGQWVVESDLGRLTVEFVETNDLGVLDHAVTLPSGETFLNPLRVFANGAGSEVVFTLLRQPDTDDEAFEADTAAVAKDLATLKALLEK